MHKYQRAFVCAALNVSPQWPLSLPVHERDILFAEREIYYIFSFVKYLVF